MEKSKVVSILTPYSPPLAPSQVDAIAAEIALVSAEDLATVTKALKQARKKTRKSKLRK